MKTITPAITRDNSFDNTTNTHSFDDSFDYTEKQGCFNWKHKDVLTGNSTVLL